MTEQLRMGEGCSTLTSLKEEASSLFPLASDPCNIPARKQRNHQGRCRDSTGKRCLSLQQQQHMRSAHAKTCTTLPGPAKPRATAGSQQSQADVQNVAGGSRYTANNNNNNTKTFQSSPSRALLSPVLAKVLQSRPQ